MAGPGLLLVKFGVKLALIGQSYRRLHVGKFIAFLVFQKFEYQWSLSIVSKKRGRGCWDGRYNYNSQCSACPQAVILGNSPTTAIPDNFGNGYYSRTLGWFRRINFRFNISKEIVQKKTNHIYCINSLIVTICLLSLFMNL